MTITLSEKVKGAGLDAPAPVMPRIPEQSGELIAIRHLSPSGEFLGTVTCAPGCVTVVQEREEISGGTFRAAMLKRSGEIDIRAGQESIHPSEIYVVQVTDRILNAPSVRDALREGGVPDRDIADILKKVGLDAGADLQPKELGISALKRLAIAASVYAKARLLLFDRPFAGSDPAWVERIAQLLLQLGESQARIMIVTGEARTPLAWLSNPRVIIHEASALPGRVTLGGAADATQNLIQASLPSFSRSQQTQVGEVITRPQLIHAIHRLNPGESLQAEAIPNPRAEVRTGQMLGLGAGLSQLSFEGMQQARREAKRDIEEENPQNEYRRTRKNTGALTQVRALDRWKQTWLADTWSILLKKVRGRVSARPVETDLPPSARLLQRKRKKDLQLYTALFIVMMFLACTVYWLNM